MQWLTDSSVGDGHLHILAAAPTFSPSVDVHAAQTVTLSRPRRARRSVHAGRQRAERDRGDRLHRAVHGERHDHVKAMAYAVG